MSAHDYHITVREIGDDIGGGYLAFVNELPGCMADGETADEALANGYDAVAAWLDTAGVLGRPIPTPVHVEMRRLA